MCYGRGMAYCQRLYSGVAPLRFTVFVKYYACGTGLFDVLCHQNSELKSDLVIAIIMVVLCRWVMNGETFTMMIRFCLGRRLVRVALQKYLTSQTRK